MINNNIFLQDLDELNLKLSNNQLSKFDYYLELLISENEKFNLTTITEPSEIYKKHFIDSLSLISYGLNFFTDTKVIDIGSGAGFPGIPLKIAFPHLKITLLDSTNKRISFLEDVIDKLNLSDIKPIHGRAEEFAHQSFFRAQYDLCVSRAVANLSTLSEYCLPFVKLGGLFIAYKGEDIDTEISEAQNSTSLLGGQLDKQMNFTLPNSNISRSLIGIKKIKETPVKYPRRAGLPGKRPL
ncbi:MAG: 16S rRNA (guanine(527)-N(7))-methyltransferase RsmG [Lachnospiraceae bacterium]|nr:16S rRNA (guanine(527)-N(7))-methyltransferase RsmG [Lachnospiraceae bacterium]